MENYFLKIQKLIRDIEAKYFFKNNNMSYNF